MYPNPAADFVHISIGKTEVTGIQIVVRDVSGKIFLQKEMNGSGDGIKIDLSGMNTGMYFLNVYNDDKLIHTEKIIKI